MASESKKGRPASIETVWDLIRDSFDGDHVEIIWFGRDGSDCDDEMWAVGNVTKSKIHFSANGRHYFTIGYDSMGQVCADIQQYLQSKQKREGSTSQDNQAGNDASKS